MLLVNQEEMEDFTSWFGYYLLRDPPLLPPEEDLDEPELPDDLNDPDDLELLPLDLYELPEDLDRLLPDL